MVDLDARCFHGFRLGQGAGHPVQDVAFFTVGLADPFGDELHDDLIGNQTAAVHELFDLLAQLGAIGHGFSEHIPGRDGSNSQPLRKELSLGSLTGAGRA